MRKDVKIGLAIAGVLFAVLIVYAFVPKKDTTQTAGTGDNGTGQQQVEGDTPDNAAPPAEPGAAPTDSGKAVASKGADAGKDVFDPKYKGSNEADGASANAGGNAGNTDWLKTFDQDKIVAVESHPSLIAQTKTPTPGTPAPAGGANERAVTDVEQHGPGGTPVVPSVGGDTPAPAGKTGAEGGHVRGNTGGPTAPANAGGRARTGQELSGGDSPRAASGGRTHIVQKDETFSTIARAVYGKQKYVAAILKANPSVNPNKLKPGTTIILPDVAGAEAASSSSAAKPTEAASKSGASHAEKSKSSERAVDPSTEYRVQQGDSLYKISVKLYGNGSHADELYDTNAAAIGPDKGRLKLGMVLKLHDAPRVKQATR